MDEPPVRLCCGQRHWTAACPDGKVMCGLCFFRFSEDELFEDEEGRWDVCIGCHEHEEKMRQRITQGRCRCPRFEEKGICRHVIPFLEKEDVEAKEDYL